jgi:hypothetical protein
MNGSENPAGVATPETPPATQAPPVGDTSPRGGVPPQTLTRERFQPFDPRRKSPILASILSLMPGLGQIYVGYYRVGFIHILVVGSCITLLNAMDGDGIAPLLGFFLAFFWMYNLIDAGRRAALYNLALEGGQSIDLPGDIPQPKMGGALLAGLILIVAGFIFLTNTLFGLSLEWIEQWWPVAPMAIGLYLVVRWMMDKAKEQEEKKKATLDGID